MPTYEGAIIGRVRLRQSSRRTGTKLKRRRFEKCRGEFERRNASDGYDAKNIEIDTRTGSHRLDEFATTAMDGRARVRGIGQDDDFGRVREEKSFETISLPRVQSRHHGRSQDKVSSEYGREDVSRISVRARHVVQGGR